MASRSPLIASSASVEGPDAKKLIDALAEAVAERGYQRTTVSEILSRSGVSRHVFYEYFAGKEDCFLAAYETITCDLQKAIERASDEADDWPHAVNAGVTSMLRFLAARPNYARLCIVEVLSSTAAAISHFENVMVSRFTPFLDPDRIGLPRERISDLPPTLRESLAGGILWILFQRISHDEADKLEELGPELVEFVLVPYLGNDVAAKVPFQDAPLSASPKISLQKFLRDADQIRIRHPAGPASPSAADLIREDRER